MKVGFFFALAALVSGCAGTPRGDVLYALLPVPPPDPVLSTGGGVRLAAAVPWPDYDAALQKSVASEFAWEVECAGAQPAGKVVFVVQQTRRGRFEIAEGLGSTAAGPRVAMAHRALRLGLSLAPVPGYAAPAGGEVRKLEFIFFYGPAE